MAALLTHFGPQIALLVMVLVEEGVKGGLGCVGLAFAAHGMVLDNDVPAHGSDPSTWPLMLLSTTL